MGEQSVLKNRYMTVNSPDVWKEVYNPVSTIPMITNSQKNLISLQYLIRIIADQEMTIQELFDCTGFRNRHDFVKNYIYPAIKEGLMIMVYPKCRKRSQQKYMITEKGMGLYKELIHL